ncbi:MAG TPA: glycosyltransferase family A protein [Verrucomicrobiae bacterium]|jgi:glycosyltransferase involved in cell wall biosynthesis
MLPIGVLIPTRNCVTLLPGHLQSLQGWLDLVSEIVVVDSHSVDGTLETLQNGLAHPNLRFFSHPPGLYQSWNFGISQMKSKYVYVATVGDSITRAGLEHLYQVAEQFQSDVVISKPHFIDEKGKRLPGDPWPIDYVLKHLNLSAPVQLSPEQQYFFAMMNSWGALLGSSASNLYTTECLKKRPFPTEFGTAGDNGWGMINAFEVKIAVTPELFSTFRHHPKAYPSSEYYVEDYHLKMYLCGKETLKKELNKSPERRKQLEQLGLADLDVWLHESVLQQRTLERCREKLIPWIFQPGAWRARWLRNHARKNLAVLPERFKRNDPQQTSA